MNRSLRCKKYETTVTVTLLVLTFVQTADRLIFHDMSETLPCAVPCSGLTTLHSHLQHNNFSTTVPYQQPYTIQIGIYSDQSLKFFAQINEHQLTEHSKNRKTTARKWHGIFFKLGFTVFIKSERATTKTTGKGAYNKLSDITFMLSQ